MATHIPSGEIHKIHTDMERLATQLPLPQASAIHYALNASRPGFDSQLKAVAGVVMHVKAKFTDKCDQPVVMVSNLDNWELAKGHPEWKEEGTTLNFYEREFILQIPKESADQSLEFKFVKGTAWQGGKNNVVELKHFGHIVDITIDDVKFV